MAELASNSSTEEIFREFDIKYKDIHGYIAACICTFGIISNSCNIYILTSKELRNSSTNILLVAIAIFDLLTETVYLPFTIYFHILTETSKDYGHSLGWVRYALITIFIQTISHAISMWMTVALATFRYIFVCKHTLAQKLCTVRRAYICVVLVAVATLALCIPYMLCYEIGPTPSSFQHNVTHLWITQTKMCTKNDGVLETFTFLIAGGVLKTGACVVLLFFTITLVVALYKVSKCGK